MIKKHMIWNSVVDLDNWKSFFIEMELAQERVVPKDEAIYLAQELNLLYLEDERRNLDIQLKNPILIISDLGLWNRRTPGYEIIESGNIKDILYSRVRDMRECKWYCDGYNIRCIEKHHDGTNFYLYREIRNVENISTLLERIQSGAPISNSILNYYTCSIAKYVAQVYGLVA